MASADGSAASGDCTFLYYFERRLLAARSIGRDLESLKFERMIERDFDHAAVDLIGGAPRQGMESISAGER